jgi:hypothetical protein
MPATLQQRLDINNKMMTAAVTASQANSMDATQAAQAAASSRDHVLPTAESLESRQEQLEQQEALARRLSLLLNKEVGFGLKDNLYPRGQGMCRRVCTSQQLTLQADDCTRPLPGSVQVLHAPALTFVLSPLRSLPCCADMLC